VIKKEGKEMKISLYHLVGQIYASLQSSDQEIDEAVLLNDALFEGAIQNSSPGLLQAYKKCSVKNQKAIRSLLGSCAPFDLKSYLRENKIESDLPRVEDAGLPLTYLQSLCEVYDPKVVERHLRYSFSDEGYEKALKENRIQSSSPELLDKLHVLMNATPSLTEEIIRIKAADAGKLIKTGENFVDKVKSAYSVKYKVPKADTDGSYTYKDGKLEMVDALVDLDTIKSPEAFQIQINDVEKRLISAAEDREDELKKSSNSELLKFQRAIDQAVSQKEIKAKEIERSFNNLRSDLLVDISNLKSSLQPAIIAIENAGVMKIVSEHYKLAYSCIAGLFSELNSLCYRQLRDDLLAIINAPFLKDTLSKTQQDSNLLDLLLDMNSNPSMLKDKNSIYDIDTTGVPTRKGDRENPEWVKKQENITKFNRMVIDFKNMSPDNYPFSELSVKNLTDKAVDISARVIGNVDAEELISKYNETKSQYTPEIYVVFSLKCRFWSVLNVAKVTGLKATDFMLGFLIKALNKEFFRVGDYSQLHLEYVFKFSFPLNTKSPVNVKFIRVVREVNPNIIPDLKNNFSNVDFSNDQYTNIVLDKSSETYTSLPTILQESCTRKHGKILEFFDFLTTTGIIWFTTLAVGTIGGWLSGFLSKKKVVPSDAKSLVQSGSIIVAQTTAKKYPRYVYAFRGGEVAFGKVEFLKKLENFPVIGDSNIFQKFKNKVASILGNLVGDYNIFPTDQRPPSSKSLFPLADVVKKIIDAREELEKTQQEFIKNEKYKDAAIYTENAIRELEQSIQSSLPAGYLINVEDTPLQSAWNLELIFLDGLENWWVRHVYTVPSSTRGGVASTRADYFKLTPAEFFDVAGISLSDFRKYVTTNSTTEHAQNMIAKGVQVGIGNVVVKDFITWNPPVVLDVVAQSPSAKKDVEKGISGLSIEDMGNALEEFPGCAPGVQKREPKKFLKAAAKNPNVFDKIMDAEDITTKEKTDFVKSMVTDKEVPPEQKQEIHSKSMENENIPSDDKAAIVAQHIAESRDRQYILQSIEDASNSGDLDVKFAAIDAAFGNEVFPRKEAKDLAVKTLKELLSKNRDRVRNFSNIIKSNFADFESIFEEILVGNNSVSEDDADFIRKECDFGDSFVISDEANTEEGEDDTEEGEDDTEEGEDDTEEGEDDTEEGKDDTKKARGYTGDKKDTHGLADFIEAIIAQNIEEDSLKMNNLDVELSNVVEKDLILDSRDVEKTISAILEIDEYIATEIIEKTHNEKRYKLLYTVIDAFSGQARAKLYKGMLESRHNYIRNLAIFFLLFDNPLDLFHCISILKSDKKIIEILSDSYDNLPNVEQKVEAGFGILLQILAYEKIFNESDIEKWKEKFSGKKHVSNFMGKIQNWLKSEDYTNNKPPQDYKKVKAQVLKEGVSMIKSRRKRLHEEDMSGTSDAVSPEAENATPTEYSSESGDNGESGNPGDIVINGNVIDKQTAKKIAAKILQNEVDQLNAGIEDEEPVNVDSKDDEDDEDEEKVPEQQDAPPEEKGGVPVPEEGTAGAVESLCRNNIKKFLGYKRALLIESKTPITSKELNLFQKIGRKKCHKSDIIEAFNVLKTASQGMCCSRILENPRIVSKISQGRMHEALSLALSSPVLGSYTPQELGFGIGQIRTSSLSNRFLFEQEIQQAEITPIVAASGNTQVVAIKTSPEMQAAQETMSGVETVATASAIATATTPITTENPDSLKEIGLDDVIQKLTSNPEFLDLVHSDVENALLIEKAKAICPEASEETIVAAIESIFSVSDVAAENPTAEIAMGENPQKSDVTIEIAPEMDTTSVEIDYENPIEQESEAILLSNLGTICEVSTESGKRKISSEHVRLIPGNASIVSCLYEMARNPRMLREIARRRLYSRVQATPIRSVDLQKFRDVSETKRRYLVAYLRENVGKFKIESIVRENSGYIVNGTTAVVPISNLSNSRYRDLVESLAAVSVQIVPAYSALEINPNGTLFEQLSVPEGEEITVISNTFADGISLLGAAMKSIVEFQGIIGKATALLKSIDQGKKTTDSLEKFSEQILATSDELKKAASDFSDVHEKFTQEFPKAPEPVESGIGAEVASTTEPEPLEEPSVPDETEDSIPGEATTDIENKAGTSPDVASERVDKTLSMLLQKYPLVEMVHRQHKAKIGRLLNQECSHLSALEMKHLWHKLEYVARSY
jgi:hypothetical protein